MDNMFVLIKEDGSRIFNPEIPGLTIRFYGHENNNVVKLYEPVKFVNSIFHVGGGSIVNIQGTVHRIKDMTIYTRFNKDAIFIGKDIQVEGCELNTEGQDNVQIVIGNNCLFSSEIIIRAADGHTLFDKDTKSPSSAHEVIIEDHCWIGQRTYILKNTKISHNSVVGACSVVTKKFDEPNVVIAGNPARIVKKNIDWSRAGYEQYIKSEGMDID